METGKKESQYIKINQLMEKLNNLIDEEDRRYLQVHIFFKKWVMPQTDKYGGGNITIRKVILTGKQCLRLEKQTTEFNGK